MIRGLAKIDEVGSVELGATIAIRLSPSAVLHST
jgi:hypothetical protein